MNRKEKQKEYAHLHYLKNKDKVKKRARLSSDYSIIRNKLHIENYLLQNPCVDCGESDPIVLEFDHVRDKKNGDISKMVRQAVSIQTLDKEIKKCEVRCANCHRRVTHNRRNNIGL